jgi:hypothetical protein
VRITAARTTEDYIRSVGRLAYLWGWPLVNMHKESPTNNPSTHRQSALLRQLGAYGLFHGAP